MHNPRLRSILHTVFGTVLAAVLSALPAMAESQVRIVRLSDVRGTVQINKNSGLGFENAFTNLPITQGTQLRTLDNGRAEVEFEDGSSLRLTPNTAVEFSTLNANDAGKRISTVTLAEGKAYLNWIGKSGDEFTLTFSDDKVSLTQPAHFRVATSANKAEIASFKNEIEVVGPSGAVKVEKNKMVTFDLQENDRATVAKLESDPYDEWDQQATDYHDQYAKNNKTPYGYGASDLSYYGNYTNVPGYGMLWQPFFAGAGWDPFMDGAWSWYPGMGFLWASAYPWGWLPYYYGNWNFVPGYGWGWQPSGFGTWHGGLHYVGAAATFHAPVAPAGTVNSVVVGRGGAITSAPASDITVNRGSAGLGILRGSYENLNHLNSQVEKHGFAQLHAAPQFAASSGHYAGLGGFGEAHSGAIGGAHAGASSGAGAGHSAGAGGGGGHSGH